MGEEKEGRKNNEGREKKGRKKGMKVERKEVVK